MKFSHVPLILLFLTLVVNSTVAQTLSVNFVDSTDSLTSGQSAGLPAGTLPGYSTFASNWNNVAGGTGTLGSLVDSGGASTGASVTWAGGLGGTYRITSTTGGTNLSGGANPTMMKGYLDGGGAGFSTTVTFSGLSSLFAGGYKVIVYADGDNFNNYRGANYVIGSSTSLLEDSENVNFNSGSGNNANGLFQLPLPGGLDNGNWPLSPNNSEGNYVTFDVTGNSFTLTATGIFSGDALLRAPINGIQIVAIPEPSAFWFLLGGAMFGWWPRRRLSP